jgi:lytic murein transglycosylase B
VAARAALLGVPLMALLFLLFPRIGPLWGLPQDAAARTGLSGSMRLGAVAEVANDDSIAMRVRFFGPAPRPDQMYFRGPVLSTFDGREWTRLVPTFPAELRPRANVELIGEPLRYEITVEPSRLPLLPLLELTPDRADAAPSVPGWLLTLRPDVQWQVDRPVTERMRVQASAWMQHRHGPREDVVGLRDLVQLPPGSNPRTMEWAAALRARPAFSTAEPRALAAAVLQHISTGGYSYTMQPGSYGDDAIDDFWLDRKQGFCEHFAAAFVVVMRALDVPARIVTGYQGTDLAPQDGYWIVRQSNAHAWAEYWQPGVGWVRVDPTAAVAPDRVRRGSSLAPQRGLVAGAMGAINPAMAARLRAQWEAVNNRWNQWVLNYSRSQQFSLLESLGMPSPRWQDLATLLIGLLCTGALSGAAWAWWDRRRQDPWQRLQRRVLQRLAVLGVHVQPHHAPRARASRVRTTLGAAGGDLAEQLEALDRLRYAQSTGQRSSGKAERLWWRQFQRTAKGLPAQRMLLQGKALASTGALLLMLGALAQLLPGKADAAQEQAAPGARKHAHAAKKAAPRETLARPYAEHPAVLAFADDVAARRGLDRDWVLRQLAAAQRLPLVQKLIMPPPPGTAKNWAAYRARFVEPQRIRAGLQFWRAHADWLDKAEARWGVPAELIVAIVGVETFYGRMPGKFRVIDALATLAFDFPSGRSDRSAFFRSELEEALVLAQREGLDPLSLKGSFAGAMGLPQFMPGSINRFAVDFDEDGHIDLLRSSADVVGSVAHFLARHGWQRGMPTHYAVAVPVNSADRAVLLGPDILPSFSAAQFTERGALLDAAGQAHNGALALVELQNGDKAPSHVAGTQNFYVVTRYNWSSYYALAVIELAQALRQAR